MPNYYELLGLPNHHPTEQELREVYKQAALKHHPDRNLDEPEIAEIKFKEVANAYEVLSDRRKKQIYDAQLDGSQPSRRSHRESREPRASQKSKSDRKTRTSSGSTSFTFKTGGSSPGFSFSSSGGSGQSFSFSTSGSKGTSFKFTMGGSKDKGTNVQKPSTAAAAEEPGTSDETYPWPSPSRPASAAPASAGAPPAAGVEKPDEVIHELACTLEELYTGSARKMQITRTVIDSATGSQRKLLKVIELQVQKGWPEGMRARAKGQGDDRPGKTPQDVVFVVHQTPHAYFKRKGDDLHYVAYLSPEKAAKGVKVIVPTLDDRTVSFSVGGGICDNTEATVKDEGMPCLEGGGFGNLIVSFKNLAKARCDAKKEAVAPVTDEADQWL